MTAKINAYDREKFLPVQVFLNYDEFRQHYDEGGRPSQQTSAML